MTSPPLQHLHSSDAFRLPAAVESGRGDGGWRQRLTLEVVASVEQRLVRVERVCDAVHAVAVPTPLAQPARNTQHVTTCTGTCCCMTRDAPVVDGDVGVVDSVDLHVVETSEVAVVSQRSLRRLHLLVRLAALTAQPRATQTRSALRGATLVFQLIAARTSATKRT